MKYLLSLVLLLPFSLSAKPKTKQEQPRLLMVGGGVFNVLHGPKTGIYQLEYRSNFPIYNPNHLFIRPLVGVMGTFTGSAYIYGGVAFDIAIGKYFAFTPSFAPGIYFQGGGKDLGFPLEFKSTFEVSGVLPNKSRIGLQFYHISNAHLGSRNPGTECLVFFYGIAL